MIKSRAFQSEGTSQNNGQDVDRSGFFQHLCLDQNSNVVKVEEVKE